MDTVNFLTPDWQEWIKNNLQNGCTPESIVEMMIENQYDPLFASAAVYIYQNNGNIGGIIDQTSTKFESGYVYETPRFTHEGNEIQTNDRVIQIVSRLDRPVIRILDEVLSAEECDELIKSSLHKLERSKVINPQTGHEEVIAERTSSGTFFVINENELITRLDRRISEIMNCPVENGEGIQILNYQIGAEYRPHYDYFTDKEDGERAHLKGGQRISTLVIYLNDVELGGETAFPELGLTVTAKKGSAVYFEYCNSQGHTDPLTLHAGLPVLKGEKWIATKWMRKGSYI